MKIIAFVVENEVCNLLHFANNHPLKDRYVNGLFSNPTFIDCSNYPSVKPGDFYINGNFYIKDDLENHIEESQNVFSSNDNEVTSFAFISNNEIFGISRISSLYPGSDLVIAGMLSSPICIDASNYSEIEIGWTWDGENFLPPSGI
jgi:hypothetical protein